jgi:riboflavin kinase
MTASIVLKGTVSSGLGEGRKFMSIPEYRKQFVEALGMDPYPGTLNLRASESSAGDLARLKSTPGIAIKGFDSGGKTFGGVKAFDARIRGIECAIVMPERTSHTDTFEVIANEGLRDELALKDGDEVEVAVQL